MAPTIKVVNLTKTFVYRQRPYGIKGLFHWGTKHTKTALDDVSLTINSGEIVGLVGPNGAGKTTLLKILTGIIYPDTGKVSVLGFNPVHRPAQLLRQIGFLMGNRNHLWWNLPAIESYLLLKTIYQIPDSVFDRNLKDFSQFLQVGDYLYTKPVRELSLGERMRCQLLATFLHQPQIVFLDEPTLGLDIIAQDKMRDFIKYYASRFNPTIILTSHYLKDIDILTPRVVIINHGRILFDGPKIKLLNQIQSSKEVKFETTLNDPQLIHDFINKHHLTNLNYQIKLPEIIFYTSSDTIPKLIKLFSTALPITNITISHPDIETIIKRYFNPNPHV